MREILELLKFLSRVKANAPLDSVFRLRIHGLSQGRICLFPRVVSGMASYLRGYVGFKSSHRHRDPSFRSMYNANYGAQSAAHSPASHHGKQGLVAAAGIPVVPSVDEGSRHEAAREQGAFPTLAFDPFTDRLYPQAEFELGDGRKRDPRSGGQKEALSLDSGNISSDRIGKGGQGGNADPAVHEQGGWVFGENKMRLEKENGEQGDPVHGFAPIVGRGRVSDQAQGAPGSIMEIRMRFWPPTFGRKFCARPVARTGGLFQIWAGLFCGENDAGGPKNNNPREKLFSTGIRLCAFSGGLQRVLLKTRAN